jgi:hypothetical protein
MEDPDFIQAAFEKSKGAVKRVYRVATLPENADCMFSYKRPAIEKRCPARSDRFAARWAVAMSHGAPPHLQSPRSNLRRKRPTSAIEDRHVETAKAPLQRRDEAAPFDERLRIHRRQREFSFPAFRWRRDNLLAAGEM